MQFRILILLSDFMQVLNSIRKHYTKNEYFSRHIIFTTIYLLLDHKLNHNKYSGQEINMINFVQATEHDVHTYAKFGYFIFSTPYLTGHRRDRVLTCGTRHNIGQRGQTPFESIQIQIVQFNSNASKL
jgi:hypothetical protein